MENNKYSDINLEEFSGISRSLLSFTARIPKIKNRNAGLVTLDIKRSRFI
jgi:hypothetical protein